MQRTFFILLITIATFSFCIPKSISPEPLLRESILKVEMNLSAFGVESDNFPSIKGYIDFPKDSNNFEKSYYNPAIKGSKYNLSHDEINKIRELLQNANLEKLKGEYKIGKTDQPTSTIIIYTSQRKFTIKDYGLEGEYPLQELYKLVYKL